MWHIKVVECQIECILLNFVKQNFTRTSNSARCAHLMIQTAKLNTVANVCGFTVSILKACLSLKFKRGALWWEECLKSGELQRRVEELNSLSKYVHGYHQWHPLFNCCKLEIKCCNIYSINQMVMKLQFC